MLLGTRLARRAVNIHVVPRANVHLSHIGSRPIPVPAAVKFDITPTSIAIEGPLGKTTLPIFPFVKIELPPAEPKLMMVTVEDPEIKEQRRMWGTTRTPHLERSVGYRVAMEEDPRGTADGGTGKRLNMKLGYSHPVFVPVPPHIKAEVPAPTKIQLFCTDKHLLGLFAAKIQGFRKTRAIQGQGHLHWERDETH
ncbi:60S ribosomal protein [Mycena sanguinolenta]|uniref:60S ribosomal protein n=1 Tax=Mycena sanguinolenta TaxID=230812 RepID=A0A8H7CQC3_9AGAR|nr:60S ribosomal protein [Mycena sanguinolenta]